LTYSWSVNKAPTSRDRQAASTRAALIHAARDRFGRDGFQGTTLEAVATDVGLTKGAAYHHFRDKSALFEAVFSSVQRELALAVARAAARGEPEDRLRRACFAYLDNCTASIARIVLVDGPAVMDTTAWQETEDRLWLGALRDLIEAAQRDHGWDPSIDAALASRVLSASITQLALARMAPRTRSRADAKTLLAAVLRGIQGEE
jgi:AcrR family transcriptional regulator